MSRQYFPQTIRDWNDLPDSLISSAVQMSDDCVQVRFTRAFKGLISPPFEPPGEIMLFGVSPVNFSDIHKTKQPVACRTPNAIKYRPITHVNLCKLCAKHLLSVCSRHGGEAALSIQREWPGGVADCSLVRKHL